MTVRLAITGATGRMGRELIAEAADRGDVEVVLAVNRDPDADEVDGVAVEDAADFEALVADREPNAVIDFTGPESSVEYVEAAADAGVPAVVGTTGFSDDQIDALRAASEAVPVLKAANFARGVQALLDVVGDAVANLPGYDVELVETHHNAKRDAPSGTAKSILREVESARGIDEGEDRRVHGREGEAPREDGEIGVHALRAGDVTGEHEVIVAGNHEEVRLTHRAESRGVFAAGAVDAAVWITQRESGWYDFGDVLEDSA
ncbi:4-hydroxy-tetrahydrodipicolinate reductase [Halostella sp. JP-L12]|uniref:4-hydroxy-tetrahydrodipicolinate reductase n=1 Tax=Halostella TaxID=1843185 RepID=UPI000EF80527|nr:MULTISPECIES: 4-hydroxy-tetrahydrodipicolinate reductase [Halostella]NHN47661.1 4-hydroxy-tetrahydrodipicolinate reductase [Halostella sp. JP-L12]